MDYLQAGSLSTILLERDVQVEFGITIIDDGIPELQEERFNVALLARSDYEVAGPNETAVYIEDDDGQWRAESLSPLFPQSSTSLLDVPPSAHSCDSLTGEGPLRCLRGR